MIKISQAKMDALNRLSNEKGLIEALAIDQRGSLKKMIAAASTMATGEEIVDFKKVASQELTPHASAILLDPEYGLPATKVRDENCGLLLAYEKTGYDTSTPGRMPDLLENWSVSRLKEAGADAIKFLLYYDPDEPAAINKVKHVFVERLGSECLGEDIPLFVEIVTYDTEITDVNSAAFARVKPHKVLESMIEFSKPQYHIDVLKMEVPVNMNYVEGFAENEVVYSKKEALGYFKKQSELTELPFIFLSAGVSTKLFQETLEFAKEAGSKFNGVLCGRATWREGVKPFATKGEAAGRDWFATQGKENIETLNEIVDRCGSSWRLKVEVG
ncbi:tagatose-bisphosphate aldolase [Enterococcus caccae]|uniref:Tagatose 1,6-diphosphate aldolase n=1 Tax=Enterococcus caccae ATCC BAA-1240 TaxID=1158612 RepID=R3UAU9_9ENTE|nr:tagatose-bisphosphate aldolase [Enterococcus caccae]EOL50523.1 tagatose 1,6-diphosphate aldolase [Enterococcus caccae ATCC BAA-1240]EOT59261.1 tagatose 1,6-diphosphate aldolase [Enterococcus caccae ATCC BAA-1240]OJG26685.1 tagatose 1,6-diphosphate aldolase [Enterococcus caccae]